MLTEIKRSLMLLLFLIFSVSNMVYAANHIIKFGGTFGLNYNPSNLNVSVGDTVTWQGSFSSHPLSSISVPDGAVTFSKNSGSSLSYIVQMAGTYNYKCDFHATSGMVGSFTAVVSSIEDGVLSDLPADFDLKQNYPNPFNPSTTIEFTLSAPEFVTLNIYNRLGQKVATLLNNKQPAGSSQIEWNATGFASGIYYYRISVGDFAQTRRMLLIK